MSPVILCFAEYARPVDLDALLNLSLSVVASRGHPGNLIHGGVVMYVLAWALLIALAGLLGCSEQAPSNTTSPQEQIKRAAESALFDKESILKPYQPLLPITEKPVPIDPFLWSLCRALTPEEVAAAREVQHGPHANNFGMFYMNNRAAKVFREHASAYPVGSVIVKEKLELTYGENQKTTGLAGMVKREAGYDPEHGNWEYFFVDDVTPMRHGAIESCVTCHAKAASSDYVFGNWDKEK